MKRSTVDIYMMSTPILVGTATTNAAGDFSTTVTVPTSLSLGTHTIQIVGTNPGNELSQASLGVLLAEKPSATPTVTSPIGTRIGFVTRRASLKKGSVVALQSLLGQVPEGAEVKMARVMVTVPKATKRAKSKLAKKRIQTVVRSLRAAGYEGAVTTRVKTQSKRNRQVDRNLVSVWFAGPTS